jgi:hypothetical protein
VRYTAKRWPLSRNQLSGDSARCRTHLRAGRQAPINQDRPKRPQVERDIEAAKQSTVPGRTVEPKIEASAENEQSTVPEGRSRLAKFIRGRNRRKTQCFPRKVVGKDGKTRSATRSGTKATMKTAPINESRRKRTHAGYEVVGPDDPPTAAEIAHWRNRQ